MKKLRSKYTVVFVRIVRVVKLCYTSVTYVYNKLSSRIFTTNYWKTLHLRLMEETSFTYICHMNRKGWQVQKSAKSNIASEYNLYIGNKIHLTRIPAISPNLTH
ncbi:hypothetical protein ACB098_11G098200 [Castanea mollissima]